MSDDMIHMLTTLIFDDNYDESGVDRVSGILVTLTDQVHYYSELLRP